MAQPRTVDPSRVEFAKALLALATALSFDLDDAVIGVYWHALKDVPSDLRVETLLEAANRKWFKFPKPAELKEMAAVSINQRRAAVQVEMMKSCNLDGHMTGGWREVSINGVPRMAWCECRAAGKAAADRIGAALELPPSEAGDEPWGQS